MTIQDISNELVEIKRYTNVLYDGIIDEVSIKPNPAKESLILITLNSAQSGTIYLNGSTVETLTYTSDISKRSTNLFTTLSGVTPASLSGYMKIQTFDEANVDVRNLVTKYTIYGYFRTKTNMEVLKLPGERTNYYADFYSATNVDLKNDDILVKKENKVPKYYVISNIRDITSFDGDTHKEMILTKTEI